ncbi:MAG TPA: amidohydrolase [Firmicutes bacterium]|nr:amidohydrolase [Candidatus Fermentithermobacillaceae bacterium]
MTVSAKEGFAWIEKHADELTKLSDKIWEWAELGLHEEKSSKIQMDYLRDHGFEVTSGAGGMPTAFVATWGQGKPVIGFLGEYDALPGVSQKVSPVREELVPGGPGHGCGHNLLGVGAMAAAIALKEELSKRGLPGTVKYFGCPAEENFSGKAFMARDGIFDDLDACLTWHPGSMNIVRGGSSLAVNSMNITFHGVSSHAAGAPHLGRSALDAVELMNVGVNFLREHIIEKARIHYVITNGGLQPNVVPAKATVWYYVRAPRREQVEEIYERVLKCAKGAAIMTDTTYEVEFLEGIYEVLPNTVLEEVLAQAMEVAGPPQFTEEDLRFAEEIAKTFPPGQSESYMKDETLPDEMKEKLAGKLLNDTVLGRPPMPSDLRGSTDVGDVSWCVPTAQFSTACTALGTPGHSWQYTAQCGMHIGHAGMIAAAKTLVQAGLVLMTSPGILEKAKEEHRKRLGGRRYVSPLSPDMKPPFHHFDK